MTSAKESQAAVFYIITKVFWFGIFQLKCNSGIYFQKSLTDILFCGYLTKTRRLFNWRQEDKIDVHLSSSLNIAFANMAFWHESMPVVKTAMLASCKTWAGNIKSSRTHLYELGPPYSVSVEDRCKRQMIRVGNSHVKMPSLVMCWVYGSLVLQVYKTGFSSTESGCILKGRLALTNLADTYIENENLIYYLTFGNIPVIDYKIYFSTFSPHLKISIGSHIIKKLAVKIW